MKIRTVLGLLIFTNITIWSWYIFLTNRNLDYAQLFINNYREYLTIMILGLIGIVLIER